MARGDGARKGGAAAAAARGWPAARERDPALPAGARARVPSVVFSAEFYCHPDVNRSGAYPAADRAHASHAFLNSGTFVGRAGSLLQLMDRFANYSLADDDQRFWTTAYLASLGDASLPRVALDHEGDVFLCMNSFAPDGDLAFDPASRRYRFRGARGEPAVFHFNGKKDGVAPFFRALGAGTGGAGGADGADGVRAPQFWSPLEPERANEALCRLLAAAALLALPLGVAAGRAAVEGDGEDGGEERWEKRA